MFRRRRQAEDELEEYDDTLEQPDEDTDDDAAAGDGPAGAGPADAAPAPRPHGPWDVEDAPEDGPPMLDIGSLRVPLIDGVEIRLDAAEDQQTIMAATYITGRSSLQVMAFAAPRSAGIWAEVRAEIAATLRADGGSAVDHEGPFGPELKAEVPSRSNDGLGGSIRTTLQSTRFLGVDGPRWFLRAVLSGAAVVEPASADLEPLLAALRATVVVRGKEAFAPRDLLPLRLPRDAVPTSAPEQGLARPQRGPEITETR